MQAGEGIWAFVGEAGLLTTQLLCLAGGECQGLPVRDEDLTEGSARENRRFSRNRQNI